MSFYVVGVCCGRHRYVVDMCCGRRPTVYTPQHIFCYPQHVFHNIYVLIYCGCMLWMTSICCGLHVPEWCPQHINVVHKVYMLWTTFVVLFVGCPQHTPTIYHIVHHIHPQDIYFDILWMYVVDNIHICCGSHHVLHICCGLFRVLPMYYYIIDKIIDIIKSCYSS